MDPLPEPAQPERLTAALRACGALGRARVRAVTVLHARPTILSHILRLRLDYDGEEPAAPRSLILKTRHPERGDGVWNGGRNEVAFYRDVGPAMPGLVPRCFDAQANEADKTWHLLLEDLTDTHRVLTEWPLPPTESECERLIDAWARVHAAWWDDSRLGVSVGERRDDTAWDALMVRTADAYAAFADRLGDRLSAERRALYERLLARGPILRERLGQRGLTIVHGDAHAWNCFLPRDGGADVRVFDWDAWRISFAATDLAYLMAVHWYPERRQRLERRLLDRYHAALLAAGVAGFDRAALDADYRLATLWHLLTPVFQAAYDIPPLIWWNHLDRIMQAVDDWDCRALLD